MAVLLISLFVTGWVAVALLGTQTYFMGEQSKPIHERNWNSDEFERLAESFTGAETDYATRTPANYGSLDAYASNTIAG